MPDATWHKAACHCGAVQMRLRLPDGFATLRRCTCSYCTMRGAAVVSAALQDIQILSGADNLSLYQFNTRTAQHFFCKTCGIYTHHQRRSNPSQFGVNVACIAGVSPFDFAEIPVVDGQNHPSDTKAGSVTLGVLRLTRT